MTGWGDGFVDGEIAQVKETGERVEAIWDFEGDKHAHIAANDGVNADFYRETDGTIIVDSSLDDFYGAGLEPPAGF